MNINIEVRKKQLASLNQYISSSKEKVDSILGYLGWNGSRILKNDDKISCPINTKHRVSIEKIEKHVEKCCLISSGYKSDDEFLSEPGMSKVDSIILDTAKKIGILNESRLNNPKFKAIWNGIDSDPMTSDRLLSTYSTDERLAIYDYSIKNTESPPIPPEFLITIEDSTEKKKESSSLLSKEEERLINERNAKRRPVKYKSIHTRNKSYTEIARELISNQMEQLEEHLKEQTESYEQFPQIDSTIVYDYEIDPYENCNVNYDYDAVPIKIPLNGTETDIAKKEEPRRREKSREREKRRRSRDDRERMHYKRASRRRY